MANSPNPDRDVEYMREMWGTTSLITDYVPEKMAPPSKNKQNNPPSDRLKKFCGGVQGFDDYVEWIV